METQIKSRRKFIADTLKGSIAVSVGIAGISSLAASCSSAKKSTSGNFATGFSQTPLPYAYNALENIIDAQTMEIHYTKHAAGYAKNLNEAVKQENVAAGTSLETLLSKVSKYSTKMRNNAGGHYNHELFWKCMRPKTADNKPTGNLLQAIETEFGSFANFKSKFSDAGKTRFGSGWAWLYTDGAKKLHIGSTPNQDNPLMDVSDIHGFPLLGIDVWEHAYYLKYQNKRSDYIDGWWNLVNWDYVQSRFDKA
ncbi:MAG TPA: superoxide dismutase [Ferruginibacter sp.]|nr:superoxide dismutase [Ferruginibacter sp.]